MKTLGPVSIAVLIAALSLPLGASRAAPTETVLWSFGHRYGLYPVTSSLIFDAAGNLYGTTADGGFGAGVAFRLRPPVTGHTAWTEEVLHSFGGTDGVYPVAGMIFDKAGNLFGTTAGGGDSNHGTVFELTPPAAGKTGWIEQVLYSFAGSENAGPDGADPDADLIFDKAGNLYGTTNGGGTHGRGTVFELMPPAAGQTGWTEQVLHSFGGHNDGTNPDAGLIFDEAGNLYGTTGFNGTVFELMPPATRQTGWTEQVLHRFTGRGGDGASPYAGLIFDGAGNLYGTTVSGGGFNQGTVFELTPPAAGKSGWTERILHSFPAFGTDGAAPEAGLIFDRAGNLYGTTNGGGTHGHGTVFELMPPAAGQTGWTEQVLYSFAGSLRAGPDGAAPWAALIFDKAGNLFGTTDRGGMLGRGTVFELMP
jgi:uncharacterized repeat protein (TIGR03803 family)